VVHHGRGKSGTPSYALLPHTSSQKSTAATFQDWRGLNFDFTGAIFDGGKFSGAEFSGGMVDFSGAEFSGARSTSTAPHGQGGLLDWIA
jgi:hypothetical protein